MEENLEQEVLRLFKLPLYYDKHCQSIFDQDTKKVADVRAWGFLQYKDSGDKIQDKLGEMLVEAFNKKHPPFHVKIESVTTEPPDWAKEGTSLKGGVIMEGVHETFTFNKESNGNWYIDLQSWQGDKADLQMVMGADTMLERFSEGENTVKLLISEHDFENSYLLKKGKETPEYGGGAYYHLYDSQDEFIIDVWLCKVTNFVFNDKLPDNIFVHPVRI
jgi:hypothetical protein